MREMVFTMSSNGLTWMSFPETIRNGAERYFKRDGREHSRRFLQDAMNGRYRLNNFGLERLDLKSFAWNVEKKDRNWWWQLQQLPVLDKAARDWNDGFDVELIQFNTLVLESWAAANERSGSINLAWHDHATAFRLKHLTIWLLYLCWRCASKTDIDFVYRLVKYHIKFLADEKNYTASTNHGFDQSLYLLFACSTLNSCALNYKNLIDLSARRLLHELRFSFTDQGVHVEDSPGYQASMIGRLEEAERLMRWKLIPEFRGFQKLGCRARRFLGQLLDEGGYLPIIGDTQKQLVPREKNTEIAAGFEQEGLFDYSKSGYFIARENVERVGRCHLVFKAGHLTSYHRHDDDLAINLSTPQGTVIGDAGLYSHNEDRILVTARYSRQIGRESLPFGPPKVY